MTRVKVEYVGGGHDHLTLTDEQAGELMTAMAARNPAHLILNEDKSRTVVNAQNIVRLDYKPASADVGSDTPDDDTDPHDDGRTVADLKAALDKAGVEYDKTARKAELQDLAAANNL